MSRHEQILWLAAEFGPLLAAAGTDQEDLLDRAVTLSYADLGVTPADGDPALSVAQQADAAPLAAYYTLRSIVRALAVQVDFTSETQQFKQSQLYAHAKDLLADAAQVLQARGYGTVDLLQLGRLNLDLLEPYA